ncbi:hypothetical protein E2C01_061733 [Portunus trituberculatus]|uniref:Uncharacterized protein n=1 Tax=Portunus trituberculatus TaxID=210409 RepID=A0A5B7HC17_PORTR|nr:hypothetical protein [Portunus trituberculatus]
MMPVRRSTAHFVLPSCCKIHPHCDLDEIGGFNQMATEGARKDNINTRRRRDGAVCGGEARVCVAAGLYTVSIEASSSTRVAAVAHR